MVKQGTEPNIYPPACFEVITVIGRNARTAYRQNKLPLELSIQKGSAPALLRQVARSLKVPIQQDCQKRFCQLPPKYGDVKVVAYSGVVGLDSLIITGTFKARGVISFQGDFDQPLCFYTQSQGHTIVKADTQRFVVNPLQCTIHGGFIGEPYKLIFPAGEHLQMMVTLIHRKAFFAEIDCDNLDVPSLLLRNIMNDDPRYRDFLFQDIYHLPAINSLNDLMDHKAIGLQHSAFAAAKIYENIYLQLRQYIEASTHRHRRVVREEQRIEIIRNAHDILLSRLQDSPTIPELAKMAGINQQTLKQGFRQLYGMTINQYLNERRLEQAGILIRGGKMTLGEVAHAVGYANGGYFSRRFKEKYGVTPKQFSVHNQMASY